MRLSRATAIAILTVCMLAAPAFARYEYPLPSPEIRDAYFLGKATDNHAAEFLATYRHLFTQPYTGRYAITEIGVLTPYAQIVLRSLKDTPGDSEVQVETDLRAQPLPFIVQVTVIFNFNNDAGLAIPQGPQRDFSVELEQAQTLAPRGMTKSSLGGKHCPCGVVIKAEVDPAKISSAPLHIIVNTPDGQSVSADFDLTKLK